MKTIEVSAKNIDKAIEEGLKLLNTTLENVDVKVISEGGMFKKAKIEMTLTPDEDVTKKEVKQKINDLKELDEELELNVKELFKKSSYEQELQNETNDSTNLSVEEQSETNADKNTSKPKDSNDETIMEEVKKYVDGLLYILNINAEVTIEKRSKDMLVKINGENLGALIGYHGEALDAIQFLIKNFVINKLNSHQKIFLDIEDYRQKREASLIELSDKIVSRVLETKKSYKLDAMNSYERRIIHTHLQGVNNISTHSEGEDPNRRLIIDYQEN